MTQEIETTACAARTEAEIPAPFAAARGSSARRSAISGLLFLVWAQIASLPVAHATDRACESLESAKFENVTIHAASAIKPKPTYVIENDALSRSSIAVTVPFCRIQGRIEKEIEFELWLPPPNKWNGKHLGVGNGGYAGFINYGALAHGLSRHYATASTDTGHTGGPADASWMFNAPDRIENYGGRAQHLTAVTAKRLAQHYYGQGPRYSYFMGCSGGGQQGLVAAQRYPNDYDGIISGAPGTNFPDMATFVMLTGHRNKSGKDSLTQAQMEHAVDKMTATCDAIDGVKDGLIEHPPACQFQFESLSCDRDRSDACLSPGQVRTLASLFEPLKDARGEVIYPPPALGTMLPVSELARRGKLGADLYRNAVFSDREWQVDSFDLARDLPLARERLSILISDDTDLTDFAKDGGRLILYHGWSDSGPSPFNSIRYYEDVQRTMTEEKTREFFRLFMVPGMYHCAGGPGPDSFGNHRNPPVIDAKHDVLMALERWVEQGTAPEQLIASKVVDGRVQRTRPLCPYPQRARYDGKGDPNQAQSFSCTTP